MPRALAICRDSELGAFLVRGLNAFCQGTAWIGCKRQPMTRELRRAYVAPYDSWGHRIAMLRFVQDIPLDARRPQLTSLSRGCKSGSTCCARCRCSFLGNERLCLRPPFSGRVGRAIFRKQTCTDFPRRATTFSRTKRDAINDLVPAFLAAHPAIEEHVG